MNKVILSYLIYVLLIFLCFATLGRAQNDLLLLYDDESPYNITITANTSNYKIDDGGGTYYFQVAGTAGKKFSVDWGDGTKSEITFTGSDQRIAKTYANAGTYKVKITGWNYLTKIRFGYWNIGAFNINTVPQGLTYLRLENLGTNVTGSIDNLPSGLTLLNLALLGTNITGSISNLPSGITSLHLYDSGILTGSINNLPSGLNYLFLRNLGTNITGSINNLPSGITNLTLHTLGTNLTGAIGSLNSSMGSIILVNCGNNFDLTTSLKAFNNANITITPQTGYGYTTSQIDNFLIAYDAVAGSGTKTIDLRGSNQPRSSASNSAVSSLTSKGRTILTNP